MLTHTVNSCTDIDSKFVVKNLAIKLNPTRFEISLKKRLREGNRPTV